MRYTRLKSKEPEAPASMPKAPSAPARSLRIGDANDASERKADRIADEVMLRRMQRRHWSLGSAQPILHHNATSPGAPALAPPIVHEVLSSPGKPLDHATRDFFEPKLGYDLSQVRVHTDGRAADSAKAVNALAYTVGHDVVFAQRQFAPESKSGQRLIAHELSHVIHQTTEQSAAATLQRDTDAAELDRQYSAAVEKEDWQTAAEKLNGFNREDMDARLAKLSSNQIQLLHEGALANAALGPESQVAQMTRPGRALASSAAPPATVVSNLDQEYAAAIKNSDWQLAAEKLNGFNRNDIKTRLAQLSPEQIENLHKGALNNPRLGARSQVAQMTDRSVTVGTSAGAVDTGVAMDQREPLQPGTDYMSDNAYIDNIGHAYYDLLTNRFELQHNDGTSFDLDADKIKRVAKAGQLGPGGPLAGGLFFRNKQNNKIYPVYFTAGTIPNIVACWNEIEKQTPEALNRTRDALIDVALSAHGVAQATISAGQKAAAMRSASSAVKPSQAARSAFAKLEPEYAKKLGVGPGGVVHHARELQLLDKYPGAFSEEELNAFGNMRGVPAKHNNTMHLSGFRKFWNEAYEFMDNVIKEKNLAPGSPEYKQFVRDVVDRYYRRIDEEFGHLFTDYGKSLK